MEVRTHATGDLSSIPGGDISVAVDGTEILKMELGMLRCTSPRNRGTNI